MPTTRYKLRTAIFDEILNQSLLYVQNYVFL